MRVYILIEEWGSYTNYSKTIVGVFSSPEAAMASRPDVPWQGDRTGITYGPYHARHTTAACMDCQADWSIEEWLVDEAPRTTTGEV